MTPEVSPPPRVQQQQQQLLQPPQQRPQHPQPQQPPPQPPQHLQRHQACEFGEDGGFGFFDPNAPCLGWDCETSWWAHDQSNMFQQAQGFHAEHSRDWCHGMEAGAEAWMPAPMDLSGQEAWGVQQETWVACGENGMPISV